MRARRTGGPALQITTCKAAAHAKPSRPPPLTSCSAARTSVMSSQLRWYGSRSFSVSSRSSVRNSASNWSNAQPSFFALLIRSSSARSPPDKILWVVHKSCLCFSETRGRGVPASSAARRSLSPSSTQLSRCSPSGPCSRATTCVEDRETHGQRSSSRLGTRHSGHTVDGGDRSLTCMMQPSSPALPSGARTASSTWYSTLSSSLLPPSCALGTARGADRRHACSACSAGAWCECCCCLCSQPPPGLGCAPPCRTQLSASTHSPCRGRPTVPPCTLAAVPLLGSTACSRAPWGQQPCHQQQRAGAVRRASAGHTHKVVGGADQRCLSTSGSWEGSDASETVTEDWRPAAPPAATLSYPSCIP